MTGPDPYADWDAAYVLGALSSAERRAYEEHVDDCARCATAVAELGMLPGLLRLVPDEDGTALLRAEPEPGPGPPPAALPRRRRGRVLAVAALIVAVLLAGGIGAAVVRSGRDDVPRGTVALTLAGVAPSPLRATVRLTPTSWGTEVAMTCTYAGDYGDRHRYALYVVDGSGQRQLVSRWQAGPGDTARTTGSTDLVAGAIERVELEAADGTVLLAGTPGAGHR